MTGTVHLSADGTQLLIRFPYREDLVSTVKELPGRRWDPRQKQWTVPVASVEKVYAMLSARYFDFAPEVSSLLAGTLGKARPAGGDAAGEGAAGEGAARGGTGSRTGHRRDREPAPPQDALSVSALNELVREALRSRFPESVWVVGEVVDFDKQAGRRHRFFTLVEREDEEARPKASVDVVLFERTASELLPRLERGADALTLQDGIEIRARVRVDLYPPSGRYQLVIEDIDPTFTLGKMALSREQILSRLREAGLIDRNRSLPLPVPCLRIGVLTSPESDGWNDLWRHLQEGKAPFSIALHPIRVQGAELKPTILAGLAWFAERASDFDVLCIVRGGGSRTDLSWFDDLDIATAVASHPLKIVVGIGHQRDLSVLDSIAHSEKTPTAVAALLVRNIEAAREQVSASTRRLADAVASVVGARRRGLAARAGDLQATVADRLAGERTFLSSAARALALGSRRCLRDGLRDAAEKSRAIRGATRILLQRSRGMLSLAAERLAHAAGSAIERARWLIEQRDARQRLLDPRAVLRRGFALVRGPDGRIRPSASLLEPESQITIQMRDGTVRAETIEVKADVREVQEEE
ncbi:MAG: exodeoxyribonuclease VII large subunit [Planctomycetota bacterium]